jgi:hypothetical protein
MHRAAGRMRELLIDLASATHGNRSTPEICDIREIIAAASEAAAAAMDNQRVQILLDVPGQILYAGSSSRVRSLPVPWAIGALRTLDQLQLSPLAPWHYLTYHKPFCFDVQHVLDLGWKPRYSNDDMFREGYDGFMSGVANVDSEMLSGSPQRQRWLPASESSVARRLHRNQPLATLRGALDANVRLKTICN